MLPDSAICVPAGGGAGGGKEAKGSVCGGNPVLGAGLNVPLAVPLTRMGPPAVMDPLGPVEAPELDATPPDPLTMISPLPLCNAVPSLPSATTAFIEGSQVP